MYIMGGFRCLTGENRFYWKQKALNSIWEFTFDTREWKLLRPNTVVDNCIIRTRNDSNSLINNKMWVKILIINILIFFFSFF